MSKLIVANWKMNMIRSEADAFVSEFNNNEAVVCAPFTLINGLEKNAQFKIGAQNVSQFEGGAYTGEISAKQLKDLGVKYCLVGHSERRKNFFESDDVVLQKAKRLLENQITPIVCVSEIEQVEFIAINKDLAEKVIIAYEPVWAIGTGKTPTVDEIEEMVSDIKNIINVTVLYGGSANENNAGEILTVCDGLLVGGASLAASKFTEICKHAK